MTKDKHFIWKIVFTIAIILMICLLGYICWFLYNIYSSGTEYSEIKSIVSNQATEATDTNNTNNTNNTNEAATYGDTPDAPLDNIAPEEVHEAINGEINFTELSEVNTDLYAWINIPNTMVDYPIAQYQGNDDTYYLNHNMYKEYAFAGCIYTEKANSKNFDDPNTVLYGHNMLNGSMFRELHNFRDEAFFNENQYIYIYLSDRTLTYRIFSAYEYDDRHLLNSFNFNDKKVFQEYLDYAQNPVSSMMYNKRDLNVTADDKIITLSTCLGDIKTSRYLVQGVLVNEELL